MNSIVFSLVDHPNKRLDKSDAGSLGSQISLVSFDASLPDFFDPNVFNFKLAFCLDLVNVSAHWDITSFFTEEIGAFVGFGGGIVFSWNYSQSTIEAVSKKALLWGYWWKLSLGIKELLS